MIVKVTKRFSFDSAHYLKIPSWSEKQNREQFHKCYDMHGHTYHCEVTIMGQPGTTGFVIDFKILKEIIQEFIMERFDHKTINNSLPGKWLPATVENMIQYLWGNSGLGEEIYKRTHGGEAWLSSIKMWETPDSFAEVSDDRWRTYDPN